MFETILGYPTLKTAADVIAEISFLHSAIEEKIAAVSETVAAKTAKKSLLDDATVVQEEQKKVYNSFLKRFTRLVSKMEELHIQPSDVPYEQQQELAGMYVAFHVIDPSVRMPEGFVS